MKEELNKGTFWGAGVGIGLSIIILIWWLALYLYGSFDKPEIKAEEYKSTTELSIDKYTTRLAIEEYNGEVMLITGHIKGKLNPPKAKESINIRIISTLYNQDDIYLQRCYQTYSYNELFTDRQLTFRLSCDNINKDVIINRIEFLIEKEITNDA